MKALRAVALCLAAMSMTACAALAPLASIAVSASKPAVAVGDKVVLEGTRGLILAHNAVQGALAIITPLIRARVLTANQVNMVEVLTNQAERLFAGADTTLTVAERAASLMLVANQLTSIASARAEVDPATARQVAAWRAKYDLPAGAGLRAGTGPVTIAR